MKRIAFATLAALATILTYHNRGRAEEANVNADYAKALWQFVTKSTSPYTAWTATSTIVEIGPPAVDGDKSFANKTAVSDEKSIALGSIVVTEHYSDENDKPKLTGVTVRYRPSKGYDAANDDWYWSYYLPDGTYIDSSLERCPLAKCGFVARVDDGRLWVFRTGSADLAEFTKSGELAKCVTQVGVGPMGMSVRAPDAETIRDYLIVRAGFVTKVDDGRLWVFRNGAAELVEYAKSGELAKCVTQVGVGPMGMTLKGPDAETLDAYTYAKPHFVTFVEDGRLWVFRAGSPDLADYHKSGELAKHVVRPGAGPNGVTIKSPDNETIGAYMAARDGFRTVVKNDRIWVFRGGTKELAEFLAKGEPANHVTRPSAGPMGMTIKAPDTETLDAYMLGDG